MHRFSDKELAVLPPEQLLAFLAVAPRPLGIREIAGKMDLSHAGRRVLPRLLQKLKRQGDVEEVRPGKYRLSQDARRSKPPAPVATRVPARAPTKSAAAPTHDPNLVEGRLVAHRDGYGFVVPSAIIPGVAGDLFIGQDQMSDAMHGDRVQARVERRRPDGRAEGRIIRVLRREQSTVVGLFRYDSRGNFVLPYDTRLPHEITIPPGEELTTALRDKLGPSSPDSRRRGRGLRLPELDGAVVNVEITRFPHGGAPPAGRVLEIIGKPGEMGVDVEIILRKHHLPHVFPPEVIEEARGVSPEVSEADLRDRGDFRQLPIVTIDGETARDFDDAVFVKPMDGGGYELQVHIADVAHYVRPGSPLDREARLRGNSVYFPDRAIPMLPEELSNGICSLNPHVDRLVMSAILHFDAQGRRVSAEFMPGVIRSAERMTYTAVNAVLEGEPEASGRYASLAADFRNMRDLALLLNQRRVARGSIDFDLPEPILEFDDTGRITGIVRSERNMAHRLIEEFMLAANEAVAEELERRQLGFLHRIHEKPDPQKVLEFEEIAHTFGYTLGVEELFERRVAVRHGTVSPRGKRGRAGHGNLRPMVISLPDAASFAIRPQHYQRLTQKIAGKAEERILSYLMLRSLRQARYSADPQGHFALATRHYTHFTSPIRRYPDLIVHRVLKWALSRPASAMQSTEHGRKEFAARRNTGPGEEAPILAGPYPRGVLDQIANESSEAERRAALAERELTDWKTAQFMEGHLGDEYDALIISVQKFGFFVELMEIFVEGLVPVNRLEELFGERFLYREPDHAFVGQRSRRAFRLGDRVHVRADRIDPLFHRVEFALVGE